MAFNSLAYLILLIIAFISSRYFSRSLLALIFLSLTFFCYSGLLDSFVFFITVISNWIILKKIQHKKLKLILSVIFNILLLIFFKYKSLFIGESEILKFNIISSNYLPLGISFYCFQAIGFQIDIYKGLTKGAKNFKEFLLFKSFFPQLIAGPIVRANMLLPQIRRFKEGSIKKTLYSFGLILILLGLIKKIVFADSIAPFVDNIFQQFPNTMNEAWIGAILYSFQVYFDFSGYSDIAIGSAYLVGFRLPVNFLSPYLSFTPNGFWKRWHISLSQWIKDYIYIPLGGSKGNFIKSSIILILTMSIAGIWHGGNLNFLLWGILWGIYIILGRIIKIEKNYFWLAWPFHMIIVVMLWVLFRSKDIYFALHYWQRMIGIGDYFQVNLNSYLSNSISNPSLSLLFWILIFALFFIHWLESMMKGIKFLLFIKKFRSLTLNSFIITLGFLLVLIPEFNTNPFIYFRF